ncbi:hypothetical protein CY34DRAFT_797869, partial [Suillus luteus UH-Slu-Lm8-n1]
MLDELYKQYASVMGEEEIHSEQMIDNRLKDEQTLSSIKHFWDDRESGRYSSVSESCQMFTHIRVLVRGEVHVEMADEEQKRQISCKNIEAFYFGPARQKQKRPLFMKRTNITIGPECSHRCVYVRGELHTHRRCDIVSRILSLHRLEGQKTNGSQCVRKV